MGSHSFSVMLLALYKAHLSCVIHLNLGDLPITGLAVVLQPGLPREEATHSKHPHACEQREEATLSPDVLPGQYRQHLPRVRPLHGLVVQGVLLGVPGSGLELPVRPDLPSHFCDETKSLFLRHDLFLFTNAPILSATGNPDWSCKKAI